MERGVHKKGIGGKRIVRKSISLSNEFDTKLKKLAISCDIPPATLAGLLVELSLDSPSVIKYLQDKYNKDETYKIYPVKANGKIIY